MNIKLNKLTKKELLIIIGNMKKDQLIEFIQYKFGGNEPNIIKEEIKFNKNKVYKKINNAMPDNKIYRSLDITNEYNIKLKNNNINNIKNNIKNIELSK